jgi:hypothetical protein
MSVTKVSNVQSATQLLAQTTLRNMLGTKSLQEILSDREAIADHMEQQLDAGSAGWGIKIERVEMYVEVPCLSFVTFLYTHIHMLVFLSLQHRCSFTTIDATFDGCRS